MLFRLALPRFVFQGSKTLISWRSDDLVKVKLLVALCCILGGRSLNVVKVVIEHFPIFTIRKLSINERPTTRKDDSSDF
jgi:hypothetical protein